MNKSDFATTGQFSYRLIADLVQDIGDHNFAAGIEQFLNNRPTDAACTAGDERHFTR